MRTLAHEKTITYLFYAALALVVYMPLHVFIVQSASLVTGGIEVWKAAKDVALFAVSPALLYTSYSRGLWVDKAFKTILVLGAGYALVHGLFLLFDGNDHTYSTIVGSVYNTRLLVYLLLGYIVGSSRSGSRYLKWLITAAVLIGTLVALFGVLQYFLPHDLLTHVGYSIERGVKPLFFIDDKPDLPRVMSTLKDPNSFGSYLIMPLLFSGLALIQKSANRSLFVRPFRRSVLLAMVGVQLLALFFTFSRGAALACALSIAVLTVLRSRKQLLAFARRYWMIGVALIVAGGLTFAQVSDTYIVQNVIFHADESTVLADPNELRLEFLQTTTADVVDQPLGYGPGTAGIVSIKNPLGTVLTENYYLQIAYEVGLAGLALFGGILLVLGNALRTSKNEAGALLLSALAGYLFYSLLIHLWSNEAVALQWWLLTGVFLGVSAKKKLLASID